MWATFSKVGALAVAVGWVAVAFASGGGWAFALTVAGGALLPLALVWFPEALGGLTRWGSRAPIDRPSPAWLVALLGWVLLLAVPALLLLLGGRNP
jgi:hypothetical protein